MTRNPLLGTRHSPPRICPPVDEDEAPTCIIRGCDEQYPTGRHELGYRTCLRHSARDPMNAIPPLIVQDVNKSNPSITRRTDFISPAYADRKVASELRSTQSYVRLGSYSPADGEE